MTLSSKDRIYDKRKTGLLASRRSLVPRNLGTRQAVDMDRRSPSIVTVSDPGAAILVHYIHESHSYIQHTRVTKRRKLGLKRL